MSVPGCQACGLLHTGKRPRERECENGSGSRLIFRRAYYYKVIDVHGYEYCVSSRTDSRVPRTRANWRTFFDIDFHTFD